MSTQPQSGAEPFACPACVEPEDREWCDHEAEWMPLAQALAKHFGHGELTDPDWWGPFLDDAGVLIDSAGPGPDYEIVGLQEGELYEHAFALGNLIVVIPPGGKDTRGDPEIVARFLPGSRIHVDQPGVSQ